jgi:hypothetical protein
VESEKWKAQLNLLQGTSTPCDWALARSDLNLNVKHSGEFGVTLNLLERIKHRKLIDRSCSSPLKWEERRFVLRVVRRF